MNLSSITINDESNGIIRILNNNDELKLRVILNHCFRNSTQNHKGLKGVDIWFLTLEIVNTSKSPYHILDFYIDDSKIIYDNEYIKENILSRYFDEDIFEKWQKNPLFQKKYLLQNEHANFRIQISSCIYSEPALKCRIAGYNSKIESILNKHTIE